MMPATGKHAFVYSAPEKLLLFSFGYPNLVVHESSRKANGIDDAESQALREATTRLPAARKMPQNSS
jgi:hypothetical protein